MKNFARLLFTRPRALRRDVYAALDIGTSKIACFIARAEGDEPPRVVGIGHQVAAGVRHGAVANMESLQNAILSTVATAEQMAGETIERVIVNVSGSHLLSQTVSIELPLNGREVTESDLQRIMAQGQTMVSEDPRGQALELIHSLPISYTLDQQGGIAAPLGMIGNNLQAHLHLVSSAFGPVRTLITAISRCHLGVEKLVVAPYASGLACLVEDEMDLGCLLIDMGAGTTSFAVFFEGQIVYADGLPVGGAHVTSDIARGLTTSLENAERLKTLHGNAIAGAFDDRERLDVPPIGEESTDTANTVPKSHLVRIIQPRIEEIFEMIRAKMDKSGFQDIAGRRVVLTGGGSQLPGVRDVAQRILDKQVRLGRPLRVARPSSTHSKAGGASFTGLADSTSGPAFATTAGLLAVAMQPELLPLSAATDIGSPVNFMERTLQWLRENM